MGLLLFCGYEPPVKEILYTIIYVWIYSILEDLAEAPNIPGIRRMISEILVKIIYWVWLKSTNFPWKKYTFCKNLCFIIFIDDYYYIYM